MPLFSRYVFFSHFHQVDQPAYHVFDYDRRYQTVAYDDNK